MTVKELITAVADVAWVKRKFAGAAHGAVVEAGAQGVQVARLPLKRHESERNRVEVGAERTIVDAKAERGRWAEGWQGRQADCRGSALSIKV